MMKVYRSHLKLSLLMVFAFLGLVFAIHECTCDYLYGCPIKSELVLLIVFCLLVFVKSGRYLFFIKREIISLTESGILFDDYLVPWDDIERVWSFRAETRICFNKPHQLEKRFGYWRARNGLFVRMMLLAETNKIARIINAHIDECFLKRIRSKRPL